MTSTTRTGRDDVARSRVVVVGGGIAGLTAARAIASARPDTEVVLVEATSTVGGKLRLGEVGGVRVDLGAESMLNRRPEAVALAREVGLGDAVVHPETAAASLWTRGALRPLPPTLMGIPADLEAAVSSGVLSAGAAARAGRESDLARPDLTDDIGVGRFVADRLGAEVRDRLVEPLLGGVYAGRADEISLHAALPQVVAGVEEHGSLLAAARAAVSGTTADGAAAPVFAGLVGGMGRLGRELRRDLESRGAVVAVGTTVTALEQTAAGWRLTLDSGDRVGPVAPLPRTRRQGLGADAVVLATPGPSSSRLLRSVLPAASGELAAVEYASMALVTLAFDAGTVGERLGGSGFLVPPVDGRAVKAATFSSRKWGWLAGGDTVVVRCSLGRFREEQVLQRDDDELVALALSDLRDATGLEGGVVDSVVARWGGALPQYAVGHLGRVGRIQAAVGPVDGLEVCGALYEGVGIAAVIANAQAAATRVVRWLDRVGTMEP